MLALTLHWVHTATYGDAVVAGCVLLLALLVAVLGLQVRASARAARDAAESGEEPFVVATPTPEARLMDLRPGEGQGEAGAPPAQIHHADPGHDEGFVRMRLLNIGLGPAVATRVRLFAAGHEWLPEMPQFYPLPAGAFADVELDAPHWPATEIDGAVLTVLYRHADGREYRTLSDASIEEELLHCATHQRQRQVKRRLRTRWEVG